MSADSRVFLLARGARCAMGVSTAKLSSVPHMTAARPPCLVHVHTYVVLAVGRAHQPPQQGTCKRRMRHAIMTHTYMPDRLHDALRRIMISRFSMVIHPGLVFATLVLLSTWNAVQDHTSSRRHSGVWPGLA